MTRAQDGLPAPRDGWYRLTIDDQQTDVWVHFGQDSAGRWVVDGLYVDGGRVLAEDLRSIPIGQIERLTNVGTLRPGSQAGGVELVEDKLVRRQEDSPEMFARKVARQYRYYSSVSSSPTKALAEAAEVPMTTARWWIREARRLGELPPGRRGKVG